MRLSLSQTPSNTPSNTPTNTNSGSPCPTNSATPTQTPTVSVSSPPPCPEEVTLTWLEPNEYNIDASGTYYRVTNYTGGTFNYGWVDNFLPIDLNTGTSPDGRNYLCYVRTVGTTAYTLTNYYYLPTSTTRYYSVFRTEGSLVNGQVITNYGGVVIEMTGTTIGGEYILSSGFQVAGGNPMYVAYPQVCPTMTPTPSVTATNTATPTLTQTQTATQTLTPSPTYCADPQAYMLYDANADRLPLQNWMIARGASPTQFKGMNSVGALSLSQPLFEKQMNDYISYTGYGVTTFSLFGSSVSPNEDPIQIIDTVNTWSDTIVWVNMIVPVCPICDNGTYTYMNVGGGSDFLPQSQYRNMVFYYSGTNIQQGYYRFYTSYTSPSGRLTYSTSVYNVNTLVCPSTPTPTITKTPTATPTRPIVSPTTTNTPSQTNTGTQTSTPTNTSTPTRTPEITPSMTQTNTPTNTATQTQTQTNTGTQTSTPTNTPSMTPTQTTTQTPTPTKIQSYCIEAMNTGFGDYSFNYINCDNILTFITIPGNDSGLLFVYCGSNPASQSGTGYAVQQVTECIDCSCPPEPPPTPSMTPTQTATQTNTPTNTVTQTSTPTNTSTPTPTPPVVDYCSYVVVNTQPSLDIPIYDVYVNGIQVTYSSGANWTITPANSPGTFNTSQTGATQTVLVYYGANIAGQRIEILDCNEVTQCQNINPGGGIATFNDVAVSCGCYWSINGYDGTC
jgi:hypothetical protein